MDQWFQAVSVIIALASALVAVVSAWGAAAARADAKRDAAVANEAAARAATAAERSNQIEEARDAAGRSEAARATLTAVGFMEGHAPGIRVQNDGPGTAREVRLLIDGVPVNELPKVNEPFPEEDQATIGPGTSLSVLFYTFMGVPGEESNPPRPWEIAVHWTDGSGKPGVWESALQ